MPFRQSDLAFLAFGCLAAFASSLGQTFFVALFAGAFQRDFGLGPGAFGGLYSIGTLAAGMVLVWAGAVVDRVGLGAYAVAVVAGLAAACALAGAAPSWPLLGAALFLLRLFGQGLMVHLAVTAMARYFAHARGRAVSLALLGLPLGEAILPRLTVGLLDAVPWRAVWLAAAAILLAVVLPAMLLLLRGHAARHAAWAADLAAAAATRGGGPPFSRRRMLADRRFLLLLPAITAPGFIGTWIFFHQVTITAAKGWELSLFASSVAAYAAVSVTATLAAGVLVDRIGAGRLLPFYLLPMGVGCIVLALLDARWACPAVLMLGAATSGSAGTVVTSFWAELYGAENLGAVRSVATSVGVAASALSPGIVGVAIDGGVAIEAVAVVSAAWIVAASLLVLPVVRERARSARLAASGS
jgi:MFS family permease